MKRYLALLTVLLALIAHHSGLIRADSSGNENSKLAAISFPRQVTPMWGPRRALVMLVSHADLNRAPLMNKDWMRLKMGWTADILRENSNGRLHLESTIVPDPVLLPGDYSTYEEMELLELYAAANQEVLDTFGSDMDSDMFDLLVYFFPTDTNTNIFFWNAQSPVPTFGGRWVPAVANMGQGFTTTPEALAHEAGHGFFFYGHAASEDPAATGTVQERVLKWTGDVYELMGYGLDMNLHPPPHMGLIYRHYWGWNNPDDITPVSEPGTYQLDPHKALLMPTGQNNINEKIVPTIPNLLWLELIRDEQAYGGETGGLLVRIDRAAPNGVYHSTLDMTPGTNWKADLHLSPGQSLEFEGRKITYVRSIPNENSTTPSAEIRVEGVGDWIVAKLEADVTKGPAPLTVTFDASSTTYLEEQGVEYSWQFADGTAAEEGTTVSHTFSQPGEYLVRLTGTDEQGAQSSDVVTITVDPFRRLFPFYQQEANLFTGVAVSNYSGEDADLEFRLFDADGEPIGEPVPEALKPGEQLAKLGSDIFGLPSSEPGGGWIELQSENPNLGTFFLYGTYGTDAGLDGSVDAVRCTNTVHFTRVFQGTKAWRGGAASTSLSLMNGTSSPVNVDLTLRVPAEGSQGETQEVESVTREIPAFGLIYESIEELFGDVEVADGIVTATTVGTPSLAGFELISVETPKTTIGLNAISEESGSHLLFSAQLASGANAIYTSLRLLNTADETRRVYLTAISEDGTRLSEPKVFDLAANGVFQQELGEVFGLNPDELSVGSLRVDSNGGGIVGDVIFGSPDSQYAAAMPLQSILAHKAVFSQVANIPGSFFTGLALHNPQSETAEIVVKVFAANGTHVGTGNIELLPGERISKLLTEDQLVPASAGVVGGYVIVESSVPVVLQQVYGNYSQSLLAAVPPTVIQ